MECSNLSRWDFFIERFVCCTTNDEKLSLQCPCSSDFRRFAREFCSKLFAVFIKNLFDNWTHFFCPSVIHVPVKCPRGGGILITLMDPSVGHLNSILARGGGNLNNNFQKSQMPGGCREGDVEASIWPIHYFALKTSCRAPIKFAAKL